jgi:hypothetical protein
MEARLQILYPTDPFVPKQADEVYQPEYEAARAVGLPVALYSHEDLISGALRVRETLLPGTPVLLRGWMLTVGQYETLADLLAGRHAPLFTCVAHYRLCHHLPEWYPQLQTYTPDTVFAPEGADYEVALSAKSWDRYFVKDHVKSLSTGRGSFCRSVVEIESVVKELRKYRGDIEGGVAIRQVEAFRRETEDRYFVVRGKAFSRTGEIPDAVAVAARQIASPFFSVDTVLRDDGVLRIVELGDGQVSDRKQWTVGQMLEVIKAAAGL